MRLTDRQVSVLRLVCESIVRRGCAPTIRELAASLGVRSTNAVAGHLDELRAAGAITVRRGRARGIAPTRDGLRQLTARDVIRLARHHEHQARQLREVAAEVASRECARS